MDRNYVVNIIKFALRMGIMGSLRKLRSECYTKVGTLNACYSPSSEPVPFGEKDGLEYQPIKVGTVWSAECYGSAWFRFTGKIPESAKGRRVALLIGDGGEGCIYDAAGQPIKGISDIGAFIDFAQPHIGKRYFELTECAEGGEDIDYFMDAGNNHKPTDLNKTAALKQADIVVVNDEIKKVYYDVLALLFQESVTQNGTAKEKSIGKSVKAAINKVLKERSVAAASEILEREMANGEKLPFTAYTTGHAHLDLAWLWPIRETQRKAVRTFVNQLYNMDKYPDYIFGASQPQQFEWIEKRYPELFEKLKEKIASGQLEVQGGMWVECDTNVPCGESIIRQNLYGKRYWKEKFGKDMRMCWLPDVFGFSGNMPQILKKCGIDYFLTIKLSWNEHNKFPHRTFIWEGIDDSSVIVHMPPDETYNSEGNAWTFDNCLKNYPEKDKLNYFAVLFGVGDGGGGPGEGHIEMVERAKKMAGLPTVKNSKAIDFFDRLKQDEDKLVRHKGELYLEKHQGTYTSQAKNKLLNRRIEFALHNTEFLCALAERHGVDYPKEKLDEIWKEVLLYQFHDIIPGSSIARVYTESVARYEKMLEELNELRKTAIRAMAGGEGLSAINATSYAIDRPVMYKDKWYRMNLQPYSAAKLVPWEGKNDSLKAGDNYIESELFKVCFDPYGNITGLTDKKTGKEYCSRYLNKLNVYRDKRLYYNAWDISIKYTKHAPAEFKLVSYSTLITDCSVIRENVYRYNRSKIIQKVVLTTGRPFVDFVTTVDWQETHKMLRADFRPSVFSDKVTCDIQMGNLKRSTKDVTKVEKAQFEIAAHKWIDVGDNEGFGIITDSKYGWRVKEGLISLNLLRSPMFPAPNADKGIHNINYALYPHSGDYNTADIQREAYLYNNRPAIVECDLEIPSVFVSSDTHIVIETVKRAEDGKGIVVRAYEDSGVERTADIVTDIVGTVYETDLLENPIGEAQLNAVKFKPFEIKTFKIVTE